jgi:hypothetical protein
VVCPLALGLSFVGDELRRRFMGGALCMLSWYHGEVLVRSYNRFRETEESDEMRLVRFM